MTRNFLLLSRPLATYPARRSRFSILKEVLVILFCTFGKPRKYDICIGDSCCGCKVGMWDKEGCWWKCEEILTIPDPNTECSTSIEADTYALEQT